MGGGGSEGHTKKKEVTHRSFHRARGLGIMELKETEEAREAGALKPHQGVSGVPHGQVCSEDSPWKSCCGLTGVS